MAECTLIQTTGWNDYELIDTGSYEKLERFGNYFLSRPEPQACWNKSLTQAEWEKLAHAKFIKTSGKESLGEKGQWHILKKMDEQWWVGYVYKSMKLRFRLGLTSFKHLGLFPEQAGNWNYILDTVSEIKGASPKVLNLFAYTGGASLAAQAAGADVVHVDSVRQVVNWSRENMEASGLDGIRWIVDDAMKFVKREVRRGNKYNGIILDPPAYGRGPDGEKWVLEEEINELTRLCSSLLEEQKSFLVLNLYSMGFSALVADNLICSYFDNIKNKEFGELYITDQFGKNLPLGTFFRMKTF
ncbi:MAG TPA: class I SAM-dependent methyltransferase [Bacteroidales bacterium]|nr:class I SAM-dependent methyltransferase [Bacteroidales bacterium]